MAVANASPCEGLKEEMKLQREMERQRKKIEKIYEIIRTKAMASEVLKSMTCKMHLGTKYKFKQVAFDGRVDYSYPEISNEWYIYYKIGFMARSVEELKTK